MGRKILYYLSLLFLLGLNFTHSYAEDNKYELYKITDAYDLRLEDNFIAKYLDYNKIEILTKDWQKIDNFFYSTYYIVDDYLFCYFKKPLDDWGSNIGGFNVYDKNLNPVTNLGKVDGIHKINEKYNQLDIAITRKVDNAFKEELIKIDTCLVDSNFNLIKKFDHKMNSCTIQIYENEYLVLSDDEFIEIYDFKTFELLTTITDINSGCYIVNDSLITQNSFLNNIPRSLMGVYNFKSKKYSTVKYDDLSVVNDYYLCTVDNDKFILDANLDEVKIKISTEDNNLELANLIYNNHSGKYYFIFTNDTLSKYFTFSENGDLICETLNMPIKFISQTILVAKPENPRDEIDKIYNSFIAVNGNKAEVYEEKYIIKKSNIENIYYLHDDETSYVIEDKGSNQIVKVSGNYGSITYTDDNRYFIITDNNKYGLMTLAGGVIIDPVYDSIGLYYDINLVNVSKDNRDMIFDYSGKCIIEGEEGYFIHYLGGNIFSFKKEEGVASFYTIEKDEPSSWAKYSIQELNKLGMIPQQYNAVYKSSITREEFAEVIANLILGVSNEKVEFENVSKFRDIDSYAINLCSSMGLIKGKTNDMFCPNDFITREEIVVIASRVLDFIQYSNYGTGINFKDSKNISDWAKQAVHNISSIGLMVGDSDGNFNPKDNTTREQAYVIVHRILNFISKYKA